VISVVLARDMPDRRTLVFCPDVADARATAAAIGSTAAVVTGATDKDVRAQAYDAFRSGTLRTLVSVMVLTEGFDMPEADCAVISRNTKSGPLRTQIIGRVLRPSPGKRDAVVLDVMTFADHERITA
jgi:superfamily II DNA or RNA helicase